LNNEPEVKPTDGSMPESSADVTGATADAVDKMPEGSPTTAPQSPDLGMSAPQTAEDVIKEKRELHSGNMDIRGNKADSQQFIQNAIFYGGNNFGIREIRGGYSAADEAKEYDLAKADDFAAFGKEYGASEYFAYAIILSVFEYAELDDLGHLKTQLITEMPPKTDDDGKTIAIRQNPYAPVASVLKVIKGRQFVTGDGDDCVGLGDRRADALKNLWTQFPDLRSNIARWLLAVSDSFAYRTNFDMFQVSGAFTNLLKMDFSTGERHILPRLYSSPDNFWLLGQIAADLYKEAKLRGRILPLLKDWVASGSAWLWRTALYAYAFIEDDIDRFDDKLRKAIERRLTTLEPPDLRFIGVLMIPSERVRTLVAEILGKLFSDTRRYGEKMKIAIIYATLLRFGYYSVSAEHTACPLLACDTKNQLACIQPLISSLLVRYPTRKMLFSTIQAYLREVSGYDVGEKTAKHIKAYFAVMADNNPNRIGDILMFLEKATCAMADGLIPIVRAKNTTIGG